MVTKEISNRIKSLGLLCTIMVVYRHSLNYLAFFDSWRPVGISGCVEEFCSRITEVAVPYFFTVSGFFFFRYNYYSIKLYIDMLKKKTQSLFIPFVAWNVIGCICLLPFQKDIIGSDILEIVSNCMTSKWYGPLWYVRDLLLLFILYPAYGWLFELPRNNKLGNLPVVFTLLVCLYLWVPVDCSILSSEGVLFFLFGGIIQKAKISNLHCHRICIVVLTIIWIYLSIYIPYDSCLHKLNTIVGLVSFWLLGEKMLSSPIWLKYSSYSFFIYVTHVYPLKFMKQVLGKYFFGNDIVALLSYLFLPIVTIFIIILFGKIYKRLLPNVYKLSMGGR